MSDDAIRTKRRDAALLRILRMSGAWGDARQAEPQTDDDLITRRVRDLLWMYHDAKARLAKLERHA